MFLYVATVLSLALIFYFSLVTVLSFCSGGFRQKHHLVGVWGNITVRLKIPDLVATISDGDDPSS